jgi:DNA repair exonuclease SbcCD nuclease subunit
MGHKIILISDIHFGVKGNSETYLNIIENFFNKTLLSVINERNINDVRILGDLFDNRNALNVRTINSVVKIFKWYNENKPSVKFKILLGNHDQYYHNRLDINSLEILREFNNVKIITTVEEENIDGYKIISFPWLVQNTEPYVKFEEISTRDVKYDLCLGHFEINGFEATPGITYDSGTDSGKFKNFLRVFSGHFHLRRSDGHISYLGSPYPITWSDYGDIKGIHIYDIETRETEFIENKDSPQYIRITINDLIEKNLDKVKKINGNFVKLVVDKKYADQIIIKAISKVESMSPKRLDVENQIIDDIDGENVDNTDISKLNNPLVFLLDYIKNLEINESNFDKTEFSSYVSNLYNSLIKDKD